MSNPKTKRCWIVCDISLAPIRLYITVEPHWSERYGYFCTDEEIGTNSGDQHFCFISAGRATPQLRKMWKKALKGLRGKNAIVECDWETWVPIISDQCPRCFKRGERTPGCKLCIGSGEIMRPMVEGDL